MHYPRVFLSIFLLTLTTAFAADLDAEVDRILAGKLIPSGPGVAVLVTKDGRPILKKTAGLADPKTGQAITNGTVFDLASVSKPLTGLVIMRLVERGRLNLDDSITKAVPDFRVPVRGRAITVRDLLQHTSGLRDYTNDYPGSDEVFAKINTETHLEWLNTTRPKQAPGTRFEYNNSNYALLALIAERVSGRSFAKFANTQIFRPARMRGTFVYDGTRNLPRKAAAGYIVRRGRAQPSTLLTNIAGDGNIYTSINGMAAFLNALQRNRIVRKTTLDQAWSNGSLDGGRPIRDGRYGYGFGWEVLGSLRSHSGGWAGTSTALVMDVEQGIAVVVMSNDENFDAVGVSEAILKSATK